MPIIRIGIGTHILQQARTVSLSLAETLVNDFVARVEADGGTVESRSCLLADVEALDPQE
jgi:hypothetical protein